VDLTVKCHGARRGSNEFRPDRIDDRGEEDLVDRLSAGAFTLSISPLLFRSCRKRAAPSGVPRSGGRFPYDRYPTGHQGPAAGIDSDCSRSTDLRLRSGGANLGASLPTEGETGGTRAQPRQQRSPREASYSMSTLVDIFAIIGAPPVR
jgi:hypothetical protein